MCYGLEQHLLEARYAGLEKIVLVKAEPDKQTKDHVWCDYVGDIVARCECKKLFCEKYEANKSGRGACIHRGKLYYHGEEVEFNVNAP